AAALDTYDHGDTSSGPTPLAVRRRFAALQLLRRLRAAGQRALHGLELSLYLIARAQARQLAVNVIAAGADLGQRAGAHQLLERVGTCLHLFRLVLCALHGQLHVAHLLGEAAGRLADAHLRLGRAVLRLHDLLVRAEGVDLGGETGLAVEQPALLRLQVLDLRGQRARPARDRLLARARGAGQVLAAQREGLAGLSVE